ncbi:hypothetical protein RDI58_027575 [Solanum bulbocastanum]|uniref:Uncharacterized protein n=1 Tax=Solanum bulbocastanum TaxID=147425 RepID=A0AAN8Y280_SOLBU
MPHRMSTWDCHVGLPERSFLLKDLGITFGMGEVHVKKGKIGKIVGIKHQEWSTAQQAILIVMSGHSFSLNFF